MCIGQLADVAEVFMDQNSNNEQKEKQNSKAGGRTTERNKRYSQGRGSNSENEDAINAQQGDSEKLLSQDYMKGRENIKSMTKGKDQKSTEKQHTKHSKSHQNKSYKSNLGVASGKNSRYGRNATRSTNPSDILVKSITTKRIETIEDIQADIERIDKEIQFEIKQIKAIKLGI